MNIRIDTVCSVDSVDSGYNLSIIPSGENVIVETNYPHCILERDKVSHLHQNIYTWILSTYLSAGAAVQTVRHLPGQAAVPWGAEGHPGGSQDLWS